MSTLPRLMDSTALYHTREHLAELLEAVVPELAPGQKESLADTPTRWVKALFEQTKGYEQDPKEILSRTFDQTFDEMVVVKDIEFSSLCEHHLLPFVGTATVGYIPNLRVVGLSKIPRLVDCFAHRLQLQERMAVEIADALDACLMPKGVGVILEAQHQCMSCRGVRKQNAKMITSVVRGRMQEDEKARAEFLKFMNH